MAWVTQKFNTNGFEVVLEGEWVSIGSPEDPCILLAPRSRQTAHELAFILRRAARRLEEIGKELQ